MNSRFIMFFFNLGVDVVLIHGLLGGVFFTWRQHDKVKQRSWTNLKLVSESDYSYCWPRDWLLDEGLDDRVRVIGVDCKFEYKNCTVHCFFSFQLV